VSICMYNASKKKRPKRFFVISLTKLGRFWFKSGEFGGHSRGAINSGVYFRNNSMVARARWALQVSQGSIQVRWETFSHFKANVFRKRCTKFYQNRPILLEDITKKHFILFFWTHCIVNIMSSLQESHSVWCQSATQCTIYIIIRFIVRSNKSVVFNIKLRTV